ELLSGYAYGMGTGATEMSQTNVGHDHDEMPSGHEATKNPAPMGRVFSTDQAIRRLQPLANIRLRIGLRTNRANPTTAKFMIAVTTKTMCQLPVASLIKLAIGTRKADVPLAV